MILPLKHPFFEEFPLPRLITGGYPLVDLQKATEKLLFIVDLPIKNGDFP